MLVKTQKGFTLIELVMVIVILGILAAIVIPQFVDLSSQANDGALKGVAGSMSSAMAVNYASRTASPTAGTVTKNCTDISKVLSGGLPANYTVTAASLGTNTGDSANCTVSQTSTGNTATFIGITVPN